jgi:NitT/TauT family transport system permease protein
MRLGEHQGEPSHRRAESVLGTLPDPGGACLPLRLAATRHAANPSDKVLPCPRHGGRDVGLLFEPDQLSGRIIFWADTPPASAAGLGLGICALSALLVGMVLGVLPPARATFGALVTTIAVIPPIALLPILFIAFGLGETAKVALIVIGMAPFMIRDLAAHVAHCRAGADGQGTDAGRKQLADRIARRAAAGACRA